MSYEVELAFSLIAMGWLSLGFAFILLCGITWSLSFKIEEWLAAGECE